MNTLTAASLGGCDFNKTQSLLFDINHGTYVDVLAESKVPNDGKDENDRVDGEIPVHRRGCDGSGLREEGHDEDQS